jgi:hypothetical protein
MLTWEEDGCLNIHIAANSSGQGHETVFHELLGPGSAYRPSGSG